MSPLGTKESIRVLIVSPHPDDGLLAMGGTIAKLLGEGDEITYVILSWAGQGFNKEEIINSLKAIGLKESHIRLLNYEVRNFPYFNSAIRQELINLREQIKPDMVFCHNSFDIHQDHEIVSKEAFRVFREGNLYGYILPWNLRDVRFDLFYELEKKHIDKKLEALKLLNSQQWRFYYQPERIKSLAIALGLFRRKECGEVFEVMSQVK